jgi:SAM-dependent methyltransferase
MTATLIPDWQHWFERWEAQQDYVVHLRQERFSVMLDALEILFDGPIKVLDLACGPGSISMRVLERFPQATCVAADLDPVLLAMGRNALRHYEDRLEFVDVDLRNPDWPQKLRQTGFDAILSTTALHWLPPEGLVTTYRACYELLRPGGVLLNGDNMQFPPHEVTLRRLQEGLQAKRREAIASQPGEGFQAWWDAIGAEPAIRDLYEERQKRFTWRDTAASRPGFEMHRSILLEAGFQEVDTILQSGHNRILVAVR